MVNLSKAFAILPLAIVPLLSGCVVPYGYGDGWRSRSDYGYYESPRYYEHEGRGWGHYGWRHRDRDDDDD